MNPLGLVFGTVFVHLLKRIVFVEAVDDFVFRFHVEGTDDEYFIEDASGVMVRLTVRSLLEEYAAGRLRECSHGEVTLSEWRGRYLGWDIAACLAKYPRAVAKYDVALAALQDGMPRSEATLRAFAEARWPAGLPAPSGRSVIRWMNNLVECDERVGAMCNRSGRQKGQSQLPPIVDRLVHQAMALFYAVEELKKMDCFALVVAAWKRLHDRGIANIGESHPHKSTVINRINKCENVNTYAAKYGNEAAERYFHASGNVVPTSRPFELMYIDGTELRQVTHYSNDVEIPSHKLKVVGLMDAHSLFVPPTQPFGGPYRAEMGMGALMGALTPPALTDEMIADDPMLLLCFGRIGTLRGDNDKAMIPPTAIGNLASVMKRVELAQKYGPDEKANLENFWGWVKERLEGEPGTVLSPRSRRKGIRYDPLKLTMPRHDLAAKFEALRLEWNATGHKALGWRTPNQVMLDYIGRSRIRFTPPAEVRRYLARTVAAEMTNDGVVYDEILYKWNREGITQTLSRNLAAEKIRSRLENTAKCSVWLRVYDWNLDMVEVQDEAGNEFVELWSDDPDYTRFLTRYEHAFHKQCVVSGATGAQTLTERALRRAASLSQQKRVLEEEPFTIAKRAGAILEQAEIRELGGSVADDPDLTNFGDMLVPTDVGGADRVDPSTGPSQRSENQGREETREDDKRDLKDVRGDWSGLDPDARSDLRMLSALEEDPDEGITWDDDDENEEDNR
ncbi:putative transposase [Sphingomonas sp. SORGH_AS870]|uniref:hypothetical protein n=1 Tax=Sphingomonas sp. SORGH_AS_0870 TaxID=3041801 RepID=UPI00286349FA|nr:hypothetical protein [Sphingomonas sp. SORGH_AS_0870]MDR6144902.1 putative transposase [Sphingomonas sp. SORGH_AS_0870]